VPKVIAPVGADNFLEGVGIFSIFVAEKEECNTFITKSSQNINHEIKLRGYGLGVGRYSMLNDGKR
jgi:hypothetical protein